MDQAVRYQETLRRLALIDEGFVEGHGATEDEIADVLVAIAPVTGLSRVVSAAPDVAVALGYDIAAALEEPDGP
jgi:hypothetical protein